MKTLLRNWPQTACVVLGVILLVFGILAVTGHATQQPWYHKAYLSTAADSVRYTWWHGWDSTFSTAEVGPTTIQWYLGAQDTTVNWIDVFVYWPGLSSPASDRVFMGNNYLVRGDSVWYQIRNHWCVPPDSTIRTVFINWNSSLVPIVRRSGPVYSDLDSIHITDTDHVEIFTDQWFSDTRQTMIQQISAQNQEVEGGYVVDTLSDTIWWPNATGPVEDMTALFCLYYKGGLPVPGAWLIASNPNVGYDSIAGVIMGPVMEKAASNSIGLATVNLPKSTIYQDSTTSLYNVKLLYGGRVIKSWDRLYLNLDTLRLQVWQ